MKRHVLQKLTLVVCILLTGCSKHEPDPSVVLAEFIPSGWFIEFDTVGAVLDAGRTAHVTVMRHYDSVTRIAERMFCIIGPGADGKLQRYAATKTLLSDIDLKTDTYIPPLSDIISLRKNVISLTFLTASAENEGCHWKEEFKFRYDKTSNRFRLIGYDFTDVTMTWDGHDHFVTTTDSRNYLTHNRIVRQLIDKDTVFKRTVKLRHLRPFMEDVKPGELTVDTHQLVVSNGLIPENEDESAYRYLMEQSLKELQEEQSDTDTTENDTPGYQL